MTTEKIKRPLFLDTQHEAHFRKYGFVKVPFFDAAEVQQLRETSEVLNGGFDTQFSTTVWSNDAAYRRKVYTELKNVYSRKISTVLNDCKTAMATILTKHPGENSAIDIHQDWAFTDETQFSAVNIWVPLVDTTEDNGALYLLPGSQLFDVPYRGRHVAPQFTEVKPLIWKKGIACNAKAGEALIFDVRMLHYSNPNTTASKRVAVAMVALPAEAPILHYINYQPEKNTVTEMEVDEDFYNNYAHNDVIPVGKNARTFELNRNQYSNESFETDYSNFIK
jgi:hypothetical protein